MTSVVDQALESYRVMMDDIGEDVIVRRQLTAPPAQPTEYTVPARVSGYEAVELVGGIKQGDRKVIILDEDLIEAGFVPPFKNNGTDKIVVRGTPLNVQTIDDNTRRIAGTLIAYELHVTG